MLNLSWVVVGDFNEILADEEKNGRHLKSQKYLDVFWRTLSICHFMDLGYEWDKFSWKRKIKGKIVAKERLNRFSWQTMK